MECGVIMLLKHYDDLSPIQIQTHLLPPVMMEWSNSGELLAVAGVAATNTSPGQLPQYHNVLKFYSDSGKLLYSVTIPCRQVSLDSALFKPGDAGWKYVSLKMNERKKSLALHAAKRRLISISVE